MYGCFKRVGGLLAASGSLLVGSAALAQSGTTPAPTLSSIQTLEPTQQEMFRGSQGSPPATLNFGAALAASRDTALIGMPAYPGERTRATADQGAVAVFTQRAGVWQRSGTLRPADAAASDYFGEGVALDGDLAAVQAESGVYVFRNTSDGWRQIQKLAPPAGVRFGSGLAVSNGTILVGAPAYQSPGVVVVFEADLTGAWRPVQTLASGEGSTSDLFGGEIALSSATLVVGAAGDDGGAGAAFVFTRGQSGWSRRQKLVPADPQADAGFGSAVAIASGHIVIGAPGADPATSAVCAIGRSGALYVFMAGGAGWREEAKIGTPAEDCALSFGTVVAAGADQVIGAAPSEFPYQLGAAYIYQRWTEGYRHWADAPDDSLVSTPILAVAGNTLLDGMPYDRGYSTGAVEVFALE